MSHRIEEKQARREERLAAEAAQRRAETRQRRMRRAGYAAVGVIGAVLVTLAVTLGGGAGSGAAPAAHDEGATASADVGSKAPAFALTDVVSDRTVTAASLRGKKTMLFFSEGVNCQACMVQAADLEKNATLRKAGIQLVSVTTDRPRDLAQAAEQYGIDTPLLADPTTKMSQAYGMLGHGGMQHATQNGHAFMLIDEQGRIAWHQAYTDMYVEPAELLSDLAKAGIKA